MFRRAVVSLVLGSALAATPLSPAAPRAGATFRVAEPAVAIDSIDAAVGFLAGDLPLFSTVCSSLTRITDKPLPGGFRVAPEAAASFPG